MLKITKAISAVTFCFLVTGCALEPDYERPQLTMPQEWSINLAANKGTVQGEYISGQWWKRFDDPILNALEEEMFANNKDISQAVARFESARAQHGLARANRFPIISGAAAGNPTYIDNVKVTSSMPYSATFNANWEIDLWGKYRNLEQAAKADFLSSEIGIEGLQLSLAGETATSYFELRMLQSQHATALRTLKLRIDALKLYQDRYKEGLISEIDLAQVASQVETAKSILYQTESSIEQYESILAILIGRSPKEILLGKMPFGKKLEELPAPPVIPAGLPSELLNRRPDIRQAEQAILSATAQVGVARAAWLPSVSLTGALGTVSYQLHDLFGDNRSDMKTLGVSASVPILDFGRVYYNMKTADAALSEKYAAYEKTVLSAFGDIRTSLADQEAQEKIVKAYERQVEHYRKIYSLAQLRYQNGYCSYLEVLDAERSLFQYELNLDDSRGSRLNSIVKVCLALGGGWGDKVQENEAVTKPVSTVPDVKEQAAAPQNSNKKAASSKSKASKAKSKKAKKNGTSAKKKK